MKRIYFGGTFDPVTYAHLYIAEKVHEQMKPDFFYFLPCHKPNNVKSSVSRDEDRLAMLHLALRDTPYLIDCRELFTEGITYTVDTLREIRSHYPDDEIYFVIGTDEFENFPKWKNAKEIVKLTKIIVVTRPNYVVFHNDKYSYDKWIIIKPGMEISSTQIRENIANNESIRYLTHDDVIRYIKEKQLYEGHTDDI